LPAPSLQDFARAHVSCKGVVYTANGLKLDFFKRGV
jgi:hypothetical protein